MIPHERSLVASLQGKPFALVGVNTDGKDKYAEEAKQEPVTWRSFDDGPQGPICRDWNISGFPTIFVLDHRGVIRHKDLRGEELERAVRDLVAAAEADGKK